MMKSSGRGMEGENKEAAGIEGKGEMTYRRLCH
jgi:hypothetical protein